VSYSTTPRYGYATLTGSSYRVVYRHCARNANGGK
jgi:hypothetical protein